MLCSEPWPAELPEAVAARLPRRSGWAVLPGDALDGTGALRSENTSTSPTNSTTAPITTLGTAIGRASDLESSWLWAACFGCTTVPCLLHVFPHMRAGIAGGRAPGHVKRGRRDCVDHARKSKCDRQCPCASSHETLTKCIRGDRPWPAGQKRAVHATRCKSRCVATAVADKQHGAVLVNFAGPPTLAIFTHTRRLSPCAEHQQRCPA